MPFPTNTPELRVLRGQRAWPIAQLYPAMRGKTITVRTAEADPGEGNYCLDRAQANTSFYRCTRRRGHHGRHAVIWWGLSGAVRAVWGVKPSRTLVSSEAVAVRGGGQVGVSELRWSA